MNNAMPPTPLGILDGARYRASTQRLELGFVAGQIAHLLDARTALLTDISDAATAAELSHLDWADLSDLWHLSNVDRGTDTLAAIHRLIGRALAI